MPAAKQLSACRDVIRPLLWRHRTPPFVHRDPIILIDTPVHPEFHESLLPDGSSSLAGPTPFWGAARPPSPRRERGALLLISGWFSATGARPSPLIICAHDAT